MRQAIGTRVLEKSGSKYLAPAHVRYQRPPVAKSIDPLQPARKLRTAEEPYRYMIGQFNQSRAVFLEITVALILLIELFFLFRGHP